MYINKGDVNFFENGCLIEDRGNGIFAIFICMPFYENEDSYLFAHVEVDVNDSWINRDAVMRFAGNPVDDMDFAMGMISYYGVQEFGDDIETLNHDEIVALMDNWVGEFAEEPWHYLD